MPRKVQSDAARASLTKNNPPECVRVPTREQVRKECPAVDWAGPVDHQTPLGTLCGMPVYLDFIQLQIIRDYFGEDCTLSHIKLWLEKRDLKIERLNWLDVLTAIGQEGKEEWARSGDGGGTKPDAVHGDAPQLPRDGHTYCPARLSLYQIGLALGLRGNQIVEKTNTFCKIGHIVIWHENRSSHYVAVDTLQPDLRERFYKHLKDHRLYES